MDEGEQKEQNIGGSSPTSSTHLTLDKAIEMGEYDPDHLANFPEWHTFSRHVQFQYIRKALDNRHKQLLMQYAELNNVLDLSKKPHILEAIKNMEKQLHSLLEEKDRLFAEYSKGDDL